MIHVLATIEVAAGKRDEVLAQFAWLTPQVRAEDGCIEYGPAVDEPSGNPNQVLARPDVIVVVEKWRDSAALKAHTQAPHMAEYRKRVAGLVLSVSLQVLRPA